jgi:hypothetical protein
MLDVGKNPQASGDTSEIDVQEVLADVSRMTNLAGAGEWQAVESIAKKIRGLVGNVPLSQRHAGLVAARNGIERASTLAIDARNAIAAQLTAVRRGRHAAARYHATGECRGRP